MSVDRSDIRLADMIGELGRLRQVDRAAILDQLDEHVRHRIEAGLAIHAAGPQQVDMDSESLPSDWLLEKIADGRGMTLNARQTLTALAGLPATQRPRQNARTPGPSLFSWLRSSLRRDRGTGL
jgi:hypothetical protein